jgi:hypothetical protein
MWKWSWAAKRLAGVWLGVMSLSIAPGVAEARDFYLPTWQSIYPTSTSDDAVIGASGSTCLLCHATTTGGEAWNSYGWSLRGRVIGGMSIGNAILAVDQLDADADPGSTPNGSEINASAQPGWTPGPNNTIYIVDEGFVDVFPGQQPPQPIAALLLDPAPAVPLLGPAGAFVLTALLLALTVYRRRPS